MEETLERTIEDICFGTWTYFIVVGYLSRNILLKQKSMHSEKLLITTNWQEIRQAEKLGIDSPKAKTKMADLLFWKSDLKKVIRDSEDGSILVEFKDESTHELEFDQKMWDELRMYFMENEE